MDNITSLPAGARSVEKRLIDEGAKDISDAELLSLFLTKKHGVPPLERARTILCSVSLIELFRNPYSSEYRALGISRRQLSQIQAGMELAKRSVGNEISRGDVLSSPQAVREYLALHIAGLEHEVLGMIWLDNRHRVIEFQPVLFRGSIVSAAVHIREILKECLKFNAGAALAFHVHPSGIPEPSDQDVKITRRMSDALDSIECRLIDHLIITPGAQVSMAERGLM